MRRSMRWIAAAVVCVPFAVGAQGSCEAANSDGCQKALDMYTFLMPQIGLGLAGGNPTLGSGVVLGKLGHFNLGVRATAFSKGGLPKFDNVNINENQRVSSTIPVKESWFGGGGADAAIGLFRGFQVGVTHVGALDALVSIMYLPDLGDNNNSGGNSGDVDITVKSHTRFGFGGRVGLLDESFAIPAVSFQYLQRGVPKVTFSTTTEDNASLGVEDLDVRVATWRVVATKTFLAFALSAGVGQDNYKADATITAKASGVSVADQSTLAQNIKRTNFFLDLTINLGPIKLAGEIGKAGTAKVTTFNTFDQEPGRSLSYYSAGLRLGF
ncbi:MAG TPA: hypothetical protein VE967_10790 [Gemmatimonadaceae bacterium]|nr:hypothetical protein [Gemmatimonadaceae bacterium]